MSRPRKDDTPAPDALSLALGERVVALRGEQGLSPAELAAKLEMDANYLWRVERGRQSLSFRNVARFAKVFGLTLSEFLEGIDVSEVSLASRPYGRKAE